ncbi:MAG: protein nirF [Gammaproteobacteria bacterium]|nr:protein nirF [Gammaproteobacteria bacterium]
MLLILTCLWLPATVMATLRGTGDLGVVIERASGSILIVEHSQHTVLGRVSGLGDLSHASVVFSRDARYAFIFGRDGGLSKVDLLKQRIVKRTIQSGNSIGGAISQDGRLIAVSNYTPGGVRIFNADTLSKVADIPADYGQKTYSKVIGLVDAPNNRFVFSLYDAGEIWVADVTDSQDPKLTKYKDVGRQPYDGLISANGRHYLAGLFGEDGLAHLDLWHPDRGIKKILPGYGKGQNDQKLPVYKMPHLEGWAIAGSQAFFPAIGKHQVLVADTENWQQTGTIPVIGQPVFVMAEPTQRQVWVNFALPNNQWVQVINVESQKPVKTLEPGKGVLHMEFTPRGQAVWISVRDENRIDVYDTQTMQLIIQIPAEAPSGIFFTNRAHKIGL